MSRPASSDRGQKRGSSPLSSPAKSAPKRMASEPDRETNPTRLSSRQKQIDFGKNTIGYSRYLEATPKDKRTRRDIRTPDKLQICSKRSWDGQVRKWRRALHEWDPEGQVPSELNESFTDESPLSQSPPACEVIVPESPAHTSDSRKKLLWSDIVEEEERLLAEGESLYVDLDETEFGLVN